MAANGRQRHATLYDFRDLDLMLRIAQEAVQTDDLAKDLGFGKDIAPVGTRLGWMRRFGMVERDEQGWWDLTPGGVRVVQAKLKAAQASALSALPDESMIEAMAYITSRYHHGDPMLATMLRREFAYGTKRR